MTASFTLRPRMREDFPQIARSHGRVEAGSAPLAEWEAEALPEHGWVAVEGERVLGSAALSPAWWTGNAEVYSLELRVDPGEWGRGAGSALLHEARSRMVTLGGTRLLTWVREDSAPSRRFAASRGFEETGQVIQECVLDLANADAAAFEPAEAELRRQGIRFAPLAELAPDEAFMLALHAVWSISGGGTADLAELERRHAGWRDEVIDGPGLSRETHWVALAEGKPAGMTFLRRLTPEAAENDFTGVLPSHRGRGLAGVLKAQAVRWGREQGLETFHTSSLLENAPMWALNTRLGYRRGVRRREVAS